MLIKKGMSWALIHWKHEISLVKKKVEGDFWGVSGWTMKHDIN